MEKAASVTELESSKRAPNCVHGFAWFHAERVCLRIERTCGQLSCEEGYVYGNVGIVYFEDMGLRSAVRTRASCHAPFGSRSRSSFNATYIPRCVSKAFQTSPNCPWPRIVSIE